MTTRTNRITWQRKVNHRTTAQSIKLMQDHPVTSHELADHVGLHSNTAGQFLRAMHMEKAVHISGWETDSMGRDCTAVYSLGEGKDVKRRKLTGAQRQANRRARLAAAELLGMMAGAVCAQ
jgi:predicted ArsR family transcriptional regulator